MRKEDALRSLAQQAREERAGLRVAQEDLDEVCTCIFYYIYNITCILNILCFMGLIIARIYSMYPCKCPFLISIA